MPALEASTYDSWALLLGIPHFPKQQGNCNELPLKRDTGDGVAVYTCAVPTVSVNSQDDKARDLCPTSACASAGSRNGVCAKQKASTCSVL